MIALQIYAMHGSTPGQGVRGPRATVFTPPNPCLLRVPRIEPDPFSSLKPTTILPGIILILLYQVSGSEYSTQHTKKKVLLFSDQAHRFIVIMSGRVCPTIVQNGCSYGMCWAQKSSQDAM